MINKFLNTSETTLQKAYTDIPLRSIAKTFGISWFLFETLNFYLTFRALRPWLGLAALLVALVFCGMEFCVFGHLNVSKKNNYEGLSLYIWIWAAGIVANAVLQYLGFRSIVHAGVALQSDLPIVVIAMAMTVFMIAARAFIELAVYFSVQRANKQVEEVPAAA